MMVPIITEVKERSEPDIPHMPGPEYLVDDRPTHSIDEIDDAGESKTMEGMMTGACCTAKKPNELTQAVGTVRA